VAHHPTYAPSDEFKMMQAPPSGIEQMCAEQQQLRVDPADGKAYTSVSFLECYGEHEVQRRWATARQQPAYTGIALSHVRLSCVCASWHLSVSLFLLH
jgi:hypothetical protein